MKGFDFKPITNFLNTLAGIGIIGSLGLMMLKPILTPEFGANIAGFVTNLTEGIKTSDLQRLKEFSTGMKNLSQGVLILVGAIGLLAAEITFFGPMVIVSSMVLTTMFVAGILGIMKILSKGRRQINTGLGALKDIAKVLTIMTIDVAILTVAATMADQINWGAAWMIVGTAILSGVFMTVAMYVSNKWRRGGDAALKTMLGLSALMLASVGAVALAAYVAREYSWDELVIGIGMIAVVAVGGYFVIEYLLKKSNRDFEKALTNMFVMIGIMAATSLVLMTLVAPLANHWGKILAGIGIVSLTIGALGLIVGILANKTKKKDLEQATTSLAVMSGIMLTISLIDLLILPKLVENTAQIIGGLAIVALEIVGLALTVGLLSKVKKQDLTNATNTMLGAAKILGIVSVASMLLIPIGMMWDSVAIGFITVVAIGAALIGLTYLLAKVKNQDLEDARNAMLQMGLIVGAVAVATLLFVPISMLADKIWTGALIVMGVVGAMTVMTWMLSKIDDGDLNAANKTMLIIGGLILGVSIIALTLFIPIAHQWEDVGLGAIVVLGIIGAMVLMTWGLSKIKEDNLRMSTIAMATMALILLGVSLITTELIIPIGYEKEDAWNGLAVVGAIIGGMLASVVILSLIKKEQLLWGILAMAGMGLIVLGVAYLVDNYIIPLGDKWEEAAKGGAVIAGTLVAMGTLVTLASYIPKDKVIAGGATIAALGGLLWLISKTLTPYIQLCKVMEADAGAIAIGGLEIAATLTAWGTLMGVIGAVLISAPMVALAIAAGGATLAGISAILGIIGKMMPIYINTCKLVYNNKEMADRGPVMLTMLLGEMGALMAAIGVTLGNPISALAISAGAGYIKQLNGIMKQLHGTVSSLVSIMKLISANNIDLARIREFNELFLGGDGIANSIKNITQRMADTGLWTSIKARTIANNIRPMFDVLSMFVDIISKTLNSRFVEEWGPDGKPTKYRSFNASDFSAAAESISTSFRIFLDQMNAGLKDIKPKSIAIMNLLGIGIRPLIGAVSSFTKSILSVLGKAIPEAFDPKTGKPTSYKKFDPVEFGTAAITISWAFSEFLKQLRPGIQALGKPAAEIIAMMGKGILPLVESIAKFTDMVLGFVNGKVYEYQKNGKTVKELVKVNPTDFVKAGKDIADAFTGFIDAIYQAFSKEDYLQVEEHTFSADEVVVGGKIGQLIESLKNIGTLVDQTQKFVNMIIKTTKETEGLDVAQKGIDLAKALTTFTDNMISAYKDEAKRQEISDTIVTVKLVKNLIALTNNTFKDLIKLLNNQHKIEELADLGKNGVDITTGTMLLIANIKMLQGIDMPDVRKIAGLPGYVKYAVKTAKQMKELSDVMLDKDITDSILKFLKDINLLTQPDLRDRSETSRRALIMFGNDLVKFTTDVKKTQVQMVKFQHQMDKATQSLRKFDDVLINNERKRQESLEKFAKAIKDITDNMANLHNQFDSLNENKILGTFGNIMNLIKTVTSSRNVSEETQTTNNAPASAGQNRNTAVVRQAPMNAPAQNTTNNFVANGGVPQQMLVTMVFSNTQFTGTMEVKNI